MPPIRLLAFIFCAYSFAGCATVSADSAQELISPKPMSQASAQVGKNNNALAPQGWWTQLAAPAMAALIEQALAHSPTLQLAALRLEQSRANAEVASANFWPNITASINRSRSGVGDQALNQNRANAGIDVSWELPLFNGQWQSAQAADWEVLAQSMNLEEAQTTLVAEVGLQFINRQSAQAQFTRTQANIAKQEESLSLTAYKVQAGLSAPLALEQVRANLAQSRAQLPDLQMSIKTATNRLATLCGLTPEELTALINRTTQADVDDLPSLPLRFRVDDPAQAVYQRADVRRASFTVLAEEQRTIARSQERWPTLSLGASWDWTSASLTGLINPINLLRSALVGLSASIWDGGQKNARLAAQKSVAQSAQVTYRQTVLTALEEMDNALERIHQSQRKRHELEIAETALQSANTIARAQYRVGLADYNDVLSTDRDLLSVQNQVVAARSAQWQAYINLYKALGGAWQIEGRKVEVTPQ